MLKYKNKILASKIVYCDNILQKGTGLIFRTKSSVHDTAWVFRFRKPRRVSITMFFVFFPIDIVFLDGSNRVIELKENFLPFHNYTSFSKISSFIELEKGFIKKHVIKNGVILKF